MVCHQQFRKMLWVAVAGVVGVLGLASEAQAATTVADVINNVQSSFSNFPNLLSLIAYVSGIFMAAWGTFKFKDHVDNPRETKLSEGVKRFLAGGFFFSLPAMTSVAANTLVGNVGTNKITNTGYTGAVLTPGGLDEMVVKMMQNIGHPTELLLVAFCYISGIGLLLVAISRLTKRMEEGPRGPAGIGTLMTFISAGALLSFPDMIGAFTTSMFGDTSVMTKASISASVISSSADADKITTVIEGVMAFVMLVGYIAFIRGWFVLKAFADGQNGATLAQGLTFLFGGALAINLGELINVLQTTVGISGLTFG